MHFYMGNYDYFVYTGCTRKTRIIDVVYNASNNELVRTKTLVKNCIVLIDSLPYRQWYETHYATPLGRKKGAKLVCGAGGGDTNFLICFNVIFDSLVTMFALSVVLQCPMDLNIESKISNPPVFDKKAVGLIQ